MKQVYDLCCSQCGAQLDYRESKDQDGDLVIIVEPCPVCCKEKDLKIKEQKTLI